MRCRISWLALALVIVLSNRATAKDRWDEIDRISRAAVGSGNFCGVSVAVLGKNASFVRAYGQADRENKRALSPEDRFHIGSVSKLFTALAVLELCESKAVSLDQEASQWLTELPAADWKGVTIRRLLSHTGGVPDYSEGEFEKITSLTADPNSAWTLERLAGRRPEFTPGAQWRYSNAGFNLLTLILERASGEPYGSFLFRKIAGPMKLPSVGLCSEQPAGTNASKGYGKTEKGYEPNAFWRLASLKGEGGICATPGDLARLPGALAGLLDEPSRRILSAPTLLNNGMRVDYGLGVRRGTIEGVECWGHTGSVNGPVAVLAHFPERELNIAVLVNTTGGSQDASGLFEEIARAALNVPRTPKLTSRSLPDDATSRYPGDFQEGKRRIRIGVENGKVMRSVVGSDKPPVPLIYLGNDTFGREDYPGDRTVFGVAAGRTESLSFYYNGLFSDFAPRAEAEPTRTD
jgi:D-alanyl-D-alanine carboxypeptidase